MCVAHVEALRLENHFMKNSLCEKKNDEKDVAELTKKYHQVLDLAEVILNILFYLIILDSLTQYFNGDFLEKIT